MSGTRFSAGDIAVAVRWYVKIPSSTETNDSMYQLEVSEQDTVFVNTSELRYLPRVNCMNGLTRRSRRRTTRPIMIVYDAAEAKRVYRVDTDDHSAALSLIFLYDIMFDCLCLQYILCRYDV